MNADQAQLGLDAVGELKIITKRRQNHTVSIRLKELIIINITNFLAVVSNIIRKRTD